ncbi:hypothetical protein [Brevibacillus laterosporus]|uniref:hypothetical protein n=1 Tax=Brevibacillus laterosporus TaxID=1465 RepID=UPI00264B10B4|nr:hypothetical protein [Brevibacillus laterosporus]MDN9011442.1 hypothetical protein [Brevibacillus laterosporus]MDO0942380.1 hypothetical protein [Brevibacillus laterosporus]
MQSKNYIGEMATYTEQIIPHYKGNLLIEALPPIINKEEVAKKLVSRPSFDEEQRNMDSTFRYYLCGQLNEYYQPLPRHFELEQRISAAMREGYVQRNPLSKGMAEFLRTGESSRLQNDIPNGFKRTEIGFSVIGTSGIGKSSSIERILSFYPQVITHCNGGLYRQ